MIPVIQDDTDLLSLTESEVNALIDKLQYSKGSGAQSVSIEGQEDEIQESDTKKEKQIISQVDDEQIRIDEKTKIRPVGDNKTEETLNTEYNVEDAFREYMLKPENGIYYRVQLAAGHKIVNIKDYFGKHSLEYDIRFERHEGWYKYSVGSFDEYLKARNYRLKIWGTTSIDDAFVSAYNSGKRITVQEALMVSNQKWYK
jgi:hypothetical protein